MKDPIDRPGNACEQLTQKIDLISYQSYTSFKAAPYFVVAVVVNFVGMRAASMGTTLNDCQYIYNVVGIPSIPTDWTTEIDSKDKDPKDRSETFPTIT